MTETEAETVDSGKREKGERKAKWCGMGSVTIERGGRAREKMTGGEREVLDYFPIEGKKSPPRPSHFFFQRF